jgi:hypothetical protein
VEVGPHANTRGPALLALLNVHWAPPAAAAWLGTHPVLARHLQRTIWLDRRLPAARSEEELAAAAAGALPEGVTGLRVLAAPAALAQRLMVMRGREGQGSPASL